MLSITIVASKPNESLQRYQMINDKCCHNGGQLPQGCPHPFFLSLSLTQLHDNRNQLSLSITNSDKIC